MTSQKLDPDRAKAEAERIVSRAQRIESDGGGLT
jgi:hypothetical protein